MYLFNPNFITDYKGYKLGMSISDWSAFAFRKKTSMWIQQKNFKCDKGVRFFIKCGLFQISRVNQKMHKTV
jgi:hypothetical protein